MCRHRPKIEDVILDTLNPRATELEVPQTVPNPSALGQMPLVRLLLARGRTLLDSVQGIKNVTDIALALGNQLIESHATDDLEATYRVTLDRESSLAHQVLRPVQGQLDKGPVALIIEDSSVVNPCLPGADVNLFKVRGQIGSVDLLGLRFLNLTSIQPLDVMAVVEDLQLEATQGHLADVALHRLPNFFCLPIKLLLSWPA